MLVAQVSQFKWKGSPVFIVENQCLGDIEGPDGLLTEIV